MATKKMDSFANIASVAVNEAVANAGGFTKFAFPFSIMDKMGLLIQRIEYTFGSLDSFNGVNDIEYMGLSVSGSLVDFSDQRDPLVVDNSHIRRLDLGAAATGLMLNLPIIKDFTNLTGGGLLVAPNPLYAYVKGVGLAGGGSGFVKVFYTYMELGTDEYWQLVESRRIISS